MKIGWWSLIAQVRCVAVSVVNIALIEPAVGGGVSYLRVRIHDFVWILFFILVGIVLIICQKYNSSIFYRHHSIVGTVYRPSRRPVFADKHA